MKRGTTDKTKFKRLVRRVGGDKARAVGILELLWAATDSDADDGAIGRLSDEDIAEAVGWPIAEARDLILILVEERWLDTHLEHRLLVHGWPEHAPDYVHQRLARQKRVFADGELPRDRLRRKKASADGGEEDEVTTVVSSFRSATVATEPATVATEPAAVATAAMLPSTAQPRQVQSSPAQPPGGHQSLVDRPAAAPRSPRLDTGPARAAPNEGIFGQIAAQMQRIVGRRLRDGERKRIPAIVNLAAVSSIPPYWLARWIEHFAEKKLRRGESFGVALIEHAAREELAAWCCAQGEWHLGRPTTIATLIPCPRCRQPSVGFEDGTIVPCVCPEKPRPAMRSVGAWLAAEAAVV